MTSLFARFRFTLALLAAVLPIFSLAGPVPANKPATYPDWWFERDVIPRLDPENASPVWPTDYPAADDYAAINQGQVKNIAKQAYEEFVAAMPEGPGPVLEAIWSEPAASTDDYAAVNIGQLKTLAKPFYDRLIEKEVATKYPWGAGADDYALANIGQLKHLFRFTATSIDEQENYYITIVSGNGQIGASGSLLSQPLVVRVLDEHGLPVANAPVSFAVASGAGTLGEGTVGGMATSRVVNSGISGLASTNLTVNGSVGSVNTVSASASGQSVFFFEYVGSSVVSNAGGSTPPSGLPGNTPNPGGAPLGRPGYWNGVIEFSDPKPVGSLLIMPVHLYEDRSFVIFEDGEHYDIHYDFVVTPKWDAPTLTWTPPSGGADEYRVRRRSNFGAWIPVGIVGDPLFVDTTGGLVSGALYEYEVIAVKGGLPSVPRFVLYDLPAIKLVTLDVSYPEGLAGHEIDTLNSIDGLNEARNNLSFWLYSTTDMTYKVEFNGRAGAHVPWGWVEYLNGIWSAPHAVISNTANPSTSHPMGFDPYAIPLEVEDLEYYKIIYRGRLLHDYTVRGSGIQIEKGEEAEIFMDSPNAFIGDSPAVVEWQGSGLSIFKKQYNGVVVQIASGASINYGEGIVVRRNDNAAAGESVSLSLSGAGGPFGWDVTTILIHYIDSATLSSGLNIPVNESSGAKYRKIALNGAPLSDEKPQQEAESDQSKEETFIDALTLGLRHDTTDVYMSVPSADLFLGARRSIATDIWTNRRGLKPNERPDRPFGTGWTSNLAASIQFTRMLGSGVDLIESPDTATVTDENGASYTFAILYPANAIYDSATGYAGEMTFVPLPTSKHEQSTHLTSLVKDGSNYIFKRKYGSTLTYAMSGLEVSLPSDRIDGSSSGQENKWARLVSVVDRYGNALDYAYSSDFTLIPRSIKVRIGEGTGTELLIKQNEQGLITHIWDPKGYQVSYGYTPVGDTLQLTSVTASDGSITRYEYVIDSEVRDVPASVDAHDNEPKFHFNLKKIKDPLNQSYVFDYDFDVTKYDYTSSPDLGGDLAGQNYYIKAGIPMYVKKVTLPNDDYATFSNSGSNVRLVRNETNHQLEFSGTRSSKVTDAEGNERVYTFTSPQVEEMESFASIYHQQKKFDVPRMIYYRTMGITSYEKVGDSQIAMGSESFTFSPEAGMALVSSIDFSDNTTTYVYGDPFTNTVFTDMGASASLYGHYSDPTQQTKILEESENQIVHTKTFTYGANRIMTSSTDENDTVTSWTVDPVNGRRLSETVTSVGGTVLSGTTFHYKDTAGAYLESGMDYSAVSLNFLTKKVVKKLASASNDPGWVGDLVTVYVPEVISAPEITIPENPPVSGVTNRVAKEIVDPGVSPHLNLVTEYTYDLNGNKRTVTDPRGQVTTFSYDKRNRLTHVTYADRHQKQFFYDARGNKIKETDENNVSTLWEYDALNRVVNQAVDMNGNGVIDKLSGGVIPNRAIDLVTSYTYNALNAKETVIGPKLTEAAPGEFRTTTTKFDYDALQRLTTKTDDLGGLNYITTYEYEKAKNPGGSVFNSSGWKPTKVTDPRGYVTEVTYDDLYRPTEEKAQYALSPAAYAITKKDYDKVGNLTQVTAPAATVNGTLQTTGTITQTTYDGLRRPVTVTEAVGLTGLEVVSKTEYTSTGFVWKTIADYGDGTHLNRTTTTEYDHAGRPVKVYAPAVDDALTVSTDKVTPITETRYDAAGNVSYVINPLGQRTDYAYDNRNRRYEEKLPEVADATTTTVSRPIRTTAYDGVGNVIAVQDARGFITKTEYDNARRPKKVTAPPMTLANGTTVYPRTESTYDSAGNVLTVTDANDHVTTNTYDALNRLATTLQKPDLSDSAKDILVANEYDAAGNRTAVIDGKSQRTEFTYDGLNRNLTVKDPASKLVTFTYDALNKVSRTDSENKVTHYIYDARHRLTDVTYPVPDAEYQLPGITYADRTADNRHYAYDLLGQLLAVTEPGKGGKADVAYTYDALGRQTSESSGSQLPALSSQLITHVYGYDLANNRVKVTYGGTGTVLTSTYDAHNRLTVLSELPAPGSSLPARLTTYGYDLNGNRVLLALPNGEETDTQYDPLNRAVAITTSKASGALLLQLTQTYDPVGNLTGLTERHYGSTLAPRTVTNTYDAVNRLKVEVNAETGTTPKTIATTYGFDPANNRTAKAVATTTGAGTTVVETAYVYNDLNQLQTATEGATVTSFSYDLNGNRATRSVQTSAPGILPVDTYAYDYENRLIGLTKDTTGGAGSYAYTYDYRTRRVLRSETQGSATTLTQQIFSGGVSVSEYSAADLSALNSQLSASAAASEYIRGSDWGGGVGGLLYSVRSGVPSYKHYNSRGDVISATNATGAATWQGTYEAYGTRTQETGTTLDRQKANTKEEDPTGLLNEGFRYRDLETGVFIIRDPLGFVDGPNMYAYVVQNPWSKFDPEGLRKDSTGFEWKDKDHHIVPVEVAETHGWSNEAKKVFDDARIATPNGHNMTAHGRKTGYTGQVSAEMTEFLKSKLKTNDLGGVSAKRQVELAKEFVEQIKNTENKFIKGFNSVVGRGPAELSKWYHGQGKNLIKPLEQVGERILPKIGRRLPIVRYVMIGATLAGAAQAKAYAESQGHGGVYSTVAGVSDFVNPLPIGQEDLDRAYTSFSDALDERAMSFRARQAMQAGFTEDGDDYVNATTR
jgi:RHS repeat-associated protein